MKQRITEKQYNEINEKKKLIWRRFMVKAGNAPTINHLPGFPSIGEMIEFLIIDKISRFGDKWLVELGIGAKITKGELCDTLWKETKGKLEK